jgi:probable rRNA maturation factor
MFSYQIINTPSGFSLDESRISLIFQAVNDTVPVTQKWILNIAFISDEEMQDLNKNYRGKDTTTDVLSFHYFEDFSGISHTDIAGECIFSQSKILSQAVEYGHTPKEEFEILLIHSVLHILGFDHEDDTDFEDMWRYEENIRTKIWLSVLR